MFIKFLLILVRVLGNLQNLSYLNYPEFYFQKEVVNYSLFKTLKLKADRKPA